MRPQLTQVADKQGGVFTRAQALVAYSRSEIETLLSSGRWIRVFRGVFREAESVHTPLADLEAARLSMAVDAVVACRDTAARLHRFAVLDDPTVHVLCSASRMSRKSGLIVHRDRVTRADLCRVRGAWCTTPARTVIDLARTYNRLDALAILDLALRTGVPREHLAAELPGHAGKRGYRQAAELLAYANPKAESPMESRTRMRCIDAGLPHPRPQVEIHDNGVEHRVDLGFEEWLIGLEYDSIDWHTGELAASRDNPRHNWLVDRGWEMFYVGPRAVYREPDRFTDQIRRAIARRRSSSA